MNLFPAVEDAVAGVPFAGASPLPRLLSRLTQWVKRQTPRLVSIHADSRRAVCGQPQIPG